MPSIQQILRASGYPDRAEYEWVEFEKAYQAQVGASLPDDERIRWLAALFGRSFYLTNRLIQFPALAQRLFQSDFLKQPKSYPRYCDELWAQIDPVQKDQQAVARLLRHYRYEETLRQTVREIMGLGDYIELGIERSDLAAACIEMALRVLSHHLENEHGVLLDAKQKPLEFCVLGMGKLGGSDLNYSSDIDLIYCYSSDHGVFSKNKTEITPHQYFVRLGEMLARLLTDRTEDGFVYRVDLDLRPEGKKGTLANSIEAMEIYYESFGDNWERMALTKAHPTAGDRRLGTDFLERVRPFVYPRTSDFSTLDQIRDLKNRIEQSLQEKLIGGADPKRPGYNVKLGIGGIREIEFFIGAFQRLYGGRHPKLQDRHTLTAIVRLVEAGLVTTADGQGLDQAYRFLRTVENRMQMLEERQTHSLPTAREDLNALALNLQSEASGDSNALDRFQEQLLLHAEQVRRSFEHLLAS